MTQKNQFRKILNPNKYFAIKNISDLPRKVYKQTLDFSGGFLLAIITLIILFIYSSANRTNPTPQKSIPRKAGKFCNIYEEKLYWQDQITPISLKYNNDVRHYIELYLDERQNSLEFMLEKSDYYFPIFESYLDKYDLPLELKYVACLESGLNPKAKSRSGALGLWQFLYSTTNLLDLEVNSYIDDRLDVYKSTDAACRYLSYLYRIFGNWELALAAYNDGPGTVQRAIERSGGETDYWKLRKFLPFQSSEYVPAFIAFNYLFENYKLHGINSRVPAIKINDVDTIWVAGSINLIDLAQQLNLQVAEIRHLNPRYKSDYIPKLQEYLYLILPSNKINEFIRKEPLIDSLKPVLFEPGLLETDNMICTTHVVRKGDFFHKLALNYNCTIEEIKKWNQIDSNDIFPGQSLIIWIKKE